MFRLMNFTDMIDVIEKKKKSSMQRLEVGLERDVDTEEDVGAIRTHVQIDEQKILVQSAVSVEMFGQLLNLCGDILAENNPFLRHFSCWCDYMIREDEALVSPSLRLVQGLQQNTVLKSLRIEGLGEGLVEGVAGLLETGVLERLELHETSISKANWTFFDALGHNQHLKQLCLFWCEFCTDALGLLGEALKTNNILQELTIRSGLTSKSVVGLMNGVASNNGLEVLDLSDCEGFEQTASVQALGKALVDNPTLKAVHLRSCDIASGLFEVGLSNNTTLELLDLAGSDFSIEELVKALEKMTESHRKRSLDGLSKQQLALKELDLSDSAAASTPRALCSLLECLARNPEIPIRKLSLQSRYEMEEAERGYYDEAAEDAFLGRFVDATSQLIRSTKTLEGVNFNTSAFEECDDDKYRAWNKAMECNNTITYLAPCFDYQARNRDASDTNWMRVLYYTRRNKYPIENMTNNSIGLFPLVCVALTQKCRQSSVMGDWGKHREGEVEGKFPSTMTSLVFELLRSSPTIFTGLGK